jgi:hypothetical protein
MHANNATFDGRVSEAILGVPFDPLETGFPEDSVYAPKLYELSSPETTAALYG